MCSRGLRPSLAGSSSVVVHAVFPRASPGGGGSSAAFLFRRRVRLRRAVTVVASSAVHGVFRWAAPRHDVRNGHALVNDMMHRRPGLLRSRGPGQDRIYDVLAMRRWPSRRTPDRRDKPSTPTPIAKQSVSQPAASWRTTSRPNLQRRRHPTRSDKTENQPPTPPGRSPHQRHNLHPPSMCARHPPAGRRPTPSPPFDAPTSHTHVAPTARRRRVKGPPQATHRRGHDDTGPPKSFWVKVRSKAVTSAEEPYTGNVEAKEQTVCPEDTKTLAHDGQTCSRRYTIFIEGKPRRAGRPGYGRFGDFYSESKSVKSPESA